MTDDPATSAKPTCALVRQGDPAVFDFAIIGMQRMLAQRYATKSKRYADDSSGGGGGGGGSASGKRKKKKTKSRATDSAAGSKSEELGSDDEEDDEEDAGAYTRPLFGLT
jgi:hypothetical protein